MTKRRRGSEYDAPRLLLGKALAPGHVYDRAETYAEDMGARITGRKRQAVIRRDGTKCYLCGIKCVQYKGQRSGAQADDALTIDHVLCLALGGTDDMDNLAVCCALCNNTKDDLPPGNEQGLEVLRLTMLYAIPCRTMW